MALQLTDAVEEKYIVKNLSYYVFDINRNISKDNI